jgi:hypothetical protein
MWKSNIEAAYRNLWLAKEWQIKQTVSVGSNCYVDHCNCFGNRASYKVFISFTLLVTWIAEHVRQIPHLKIYSDDNASFDVVGNVLFYEPYHRYFPCSQARLLCLWDELNIPHTEKKQIYGPIVPFVGFDVDPNVMTISINNGWRANLFEKILGFAKPGKRHTLCNFQSLAGYLNWSFAVFPLLKPSLSAVYAKMSGKSLSLASSESTMQSVKSSNGFSSMPACLMGSFSSTPLPGTQLRTFKTHLSVSLTHAWEVWHSGILSFGWATNVVSVLGTPRPFFIGRPSQSPVL